MAQDFYRRAQVLHEEFQRRELQYLNAEKKWNNMIWNKDLSLPLQEYMQKIERKERETEETYKNMIKQMEDLDKRTDLMSLKLDKLGTLRSNMATLEASTWPYNMTQSNPLTFNAINRFQGDANFDFLSPKPSLRSATTQTENKIYCQKCNSQVSAFDLSTPSSITGHLQDTSIESQAFTSAGNFQNFVPNTPQAIYLPNPLDYSTPLYRNQKIANSMISSEFSDKPLLVSGTERTFAIESKPSEKDSAGLLKQTLDSSALLEEQISVTDNDACLNRKLTEKFGRNYYKSSEQASRRFSKPNENSDNLLEEPNFTEDSNTLQSRIHISETPQLVDTEQSSVKFLNPSGDTSAVLERQGASMKQNGTQDSKVVSNKSSSASVKAATSVLDDTKLKFASEGTKESPKPAEIEDNVEVSVSKSDEGSMKSLNREFDFLESDNANVSKDTISQNDDKTPKSPVKNRDASSAQLKPKEQLTVVSEQHKSDAVGDKSDISSSVTGPASPSIRSTNISIASDSDSIGEKETPLKASAAYQALLGNTAVLEKSRKKYLDSDSEDEVESALANAVRRSSHVLPERKKDDKSTLPSKDEKSAVQEVDPKPTMKSSKPSLTSKPQSKLSKSMRKVLGLETSSGSEVEIAAKPPGKKIDEDSDEFDFFD